MAHVHTDIQYTDTHGERGGKRVKGRWSERESELEYSYSLWTVLKIKTSSGLFFISFDGLQGTKRPRSADGTLTMTSVVF